MSCTLSRVSTFAQVAPLLKKLTARNVGATETEELYKIEDQVRAILARVQQKGLNAIIDYTRTFDSPNFTEQQFKVSVTACEQAYLSLSFDDKTMLTNAIEHIRQFHERQKQQSWFMTKEDGSILGQRVVAIDRAGVYVPAGQSGSTPLISSLLMGVIPAQVAGVAEIAIASPPNEQGCVNTTILAVAHMLGVTEVYAAGSAWGVAALAYGAGALQPVDVIVGPGNIYVATAKRLLLGSVGIDMIAGPSEILIIADATANPAWVAADMLGQAEHDALASAICLCFCEDIAKKVQQELNKQLKTLPRNDIAQKSLKDYGAIVVVPDFLLATEISNAIAPEHLELLVENPWVLLPRIRHAGAVFMGHYAAEVLGDYYAGPNHVLPTMGTARFSSALGVDTFCKKMSVIAPSVAFVKESSAQVARFARLEALEGHARSALFRTQKKDGTPL